MRPAPSRCVGCQTLSQSLRSSLGSASFAGLDGFRCRQKVGKRQFLFHDGDQPAGAYCIASGSVKLFKTGPDGEEHILGLGLRGTLLGVRALIAGEPYSASAQAREDTTLCFFEADKFMRFLEKSPEASHAVLSQLGRQLRQAREELLERSSASAPKRLARCLGQLAERYAPFGGRIRVSGQEMAAMIGVTPETISRMMKVFSQAGILSSRGREIKILDAAGLAEAAGDELPSWRQRSSPKKEAPVFSLL